MPRRGRDETTALALSVSPGGPLSLVGRRESLVNVMHTSSLRAGGLSATDVRRLS